MVSSHGDDRPSWLPGPCPAWCTRAHREDDPTEDRIHQDDGAVLPVVLGRVDPALLRYAPHAADLVVRRVRDLPPGSPTWVVITESEAVERTLVLTEESADRLRGALPRDA